jgi:hypothetical protein
MLGKNLIRVLAVGAFAIAPAALTVAVPGTANAAAKTITCSSVSGTLATQKLAGCTGGSTLGATAKVTNLGKLITWSAKGGGTNTLTVSDKSLTGKSDTCKAPKGQTNKFLVEESGSVKSGTGAAKVLAGGKTSAKVCVYSSSVALYPGTKFSL